MKPWRSFISVLLITCLMAQTTTPAMSLGPKTEASMDVAWPVDSSRFASEALDARPFWINSAKFFLAAGRGVRAGAIRGVSQASWRDIAENTLTLLAVYHFAGMALRHFGIELPGAELFSGISWTVVLPFRAAPRLRSAATDADLFALLGPGAVRERIRAEAWAVNQIDQLRSSLPENSASNINIEEAVDLALAQKGWEEFDFKAWRERLQSQLRGSAVTSGRNLRLIFLPPSQSSYFFGTFEHPSPVLIQEWSKEETAVIISLPMIEDLDSLVDDDAEMAAAIIEQARRTLDGAVVTPSAEIQTALGIFASQVAPARGARAEPDEGTAGAPPLNSVERQRLAALTSGVRVVSAAASDWMSYPPVTLKTRPSKKSGADWFRETVLAFSVEAARAGKHKVPSTYEEAIQEWRMDLAHFPFDKERCAYNHEIEWGFNFYNAELKKRIQLGPDEIVKFGFLTRTERDEHQEQYRLARRNMNDQVPFLQSDLLFLRYPENVEALLRSSLSTEDKLQAQAFARISARPGYYRLVNVFDQEIQLPGRKVAVSWDALMRIMAMARELERHPHLNLRLPRSVRSEGEHIRLGIAQAVQMAQRGDSSGWRRIASRYSAWIANGAPFTIWMGAMLQFASSVNRNRFSPGKSMNLVRRIGTFADGPALAARALFNARSVFEPLGLNFKKVKIFSFDFVAEMLSAGRAAMPVGSYHPTAADLLQRHFPVKDGSLDMALTGIFGTIEPETAEGEAIPPDEGQRKAHLLVEMNRILSERGYLVLTVKNRALPEETQKAIERFGFQVVTGPNPRLRYSTGLLEKLTNGNRDQINKLNQQLAGASCLVAVKTRELADSDAALQKDPTLLEALRYSDHATPVEVQQARRASQARGDSREIALTNLDYSGLMLSDIPQDMIRRSEMAADDELATFEHFLDCLVYFNDQLSPVDQDRMKRMLALWSDRGVEEFPTELVQWVLDRVKGQPFRTPKPKDDATVQTKSTLPSHRRLRADVPRTSSLRPTLWDRFLREEAARLDADDGEFPTRLRQRRAVIVETVAPVSAGTSDGLSAGTPAEAGPQLVPPTPSRTSKPTPEPTRKKQPKVVAMPPRAPDYARLQQRLQEILMPIKDNAYLTQSMYNQLTSTLEAELGRPMPATVLEAGRAALGFHATNAESIETFSHFIWTLNNDYNRFSGFIIDPGPLWHPDQDREPALRLMHWSVGAPRAVTKFQLGDHLETYHYRIEEALPWRDSVMAYSSLSFGSVLQTDMIRAMFENQFAHFQKVMTAVHQGREPNADPRKAQIDRYLAQWARKAFPRVRTPAQFADQLAAVAESSIIMIHAGWELGEEAWTEDPGLIIRGVDVESRLAVDHLRAFVGFAKRYLRQPLDKLDAVNNTGGSELQGQLAYLELRGYMSAFGTLNAILDERSVTPLVATRLQNFLIAEREKREERSDLGDVRFLCLLAHAVGVPADWHDLLFNREGTYLTAIAVSDRLLAMDETEIRKLLRRARNTTYKIALHRSGTKIEIEPTPEEVDEDPLAALPDGENTVESTESPGATGTAESALPEQVAVAVRAIQEVIKVPKQKNAITAELVEQWARNPDREYAWRQTSRLKISIPKEPFLKILDSLGLRETSDPGARGPTGRLSANVQSALSHFVRMSFQKAFIDKETWQKMRAALVRALGNAGDLAVLDRKAAALSAPLDQPGHRRYQDLFDFLSELNHGWLMEHGTVIYAYGNINPYDTRVGWTTSVLSFNPALTRWYDVIPLGKRYALNRITSASDSTESPAVGTGYADAFLLPMNWPRSRTKQLEGLREKRKAWHDRQREITYVPEEDDNGMSAAWDEKAFGEAPTAADLEEMDTEKYSLEHLVGGALRMKTDATYARNPDRQATLDAETPAMVEGYMILLLRDFTIRGSVIRELWRDAKRRMTFQVKEVDHGLASAAWGAYRALFVARYSRNAARAFRWHFNDDLIKDAEDKIRFDELVLYYLLGRQLKVLKNVPFSQFAKSGWVKPYLREISQKMLAIDDQSLRDLATATIDANFKIRVDLDQEHQRITIHEKEGLGQKFLGLFLRRGSRTVVAFFLALSAFHHIPSYNRLLSSHA